MYTDDIKIFTKNEKEFEENDRNIQRWNTGQKKSGKGQITEGIIELPKQKRIRTLVEKETY